MLRPSKITKSFNFERSGSENSLHSVPIIKISADLITNANGLVVTAAQTADRLFGLQTFSTPVVVTTGSSLFTVSFGVNQASSLWMTSDGVPENEYQVYAIGSGPFSTFMTVESVFE